LCDNFSLSFFLFCLIFFTLAKEYANDDEIAARYSRTTSIKMPGRRKKKKKSDKGPQLPKYIQQQLAFREEREDIVSGFENADFRKSAGGDDEEEEEMFRNDDKGGRRGRQSTTTTTMSRKQKRQEMKNEKKMNKKRRFEMMSAKNKNKKKEEHLVVEKKKKKTKAATTRVEKDDDTKSAKMKKSAKTKKETDEKKEKNKPPRQIAMRQSLLDAYREDEFNAKQLEKKMGKKKIEDGLDLFMEGLPGLELLGDGGDDDRESDDDASDSEDSDDLSEEEELSSSSSGEEEEEEEEDEDLEMSTSEEDEEEKEKKDALEAAHANFKPSATKYVPPAQRAAMKAAAEAAAATGNNNNNNSKKNKTVRDIDDPSFETQRRIIRGLLNRLGEANVANIVAEISGVAREHPRKTVGDCVSEELVHKALAEGPKASESYCAAIACLVAGCSGEIGPEFAARFAANVCERFELERQKDESSRPASNLALCLAKLYNIGLFPSAVVYGCLISLAKTLSEMDSGLTLTILKVSGGKLRGEDPVGMKSYIDALSETARALKSKNGAAEGSGGGLSKRARLTLELVLDLKNNKISKSESDVSGKDQYGIPIALSRWVKTANRVGEVTVALRSLTYDILTDDALEKTGNWWLPEAAGTEEWFKKRNAERSSNANNDDDGNETQLLQLAKKMRMNTETRRAIFCVVMSSEDYADCLERLLKLPLSGQGDREIVRVILECCLQEKAFNPYYAILTSKLVERQKRHRLTLRLCIQDQLKEIKSGENEETSSVRRVANLAKFFAHTIAANALGTNALRILEMSEFENMNSRINLFNRLFCRAILEDRQRTAKIDILFAKLREKKEYNDLARDFLRTFTSREILRGVEDEAARKRIQGRGLALKHVITDGLRGGRENDADATTNGGIMNLTNNSNSRRM